MDCYAEAVEADPNYANTFFNAADAAYQLGRYIEAANMLHRGLSLEPTNAAGFFVLGNCYFQTQDYEAARVSYKAALERDPDHAAARSNLDLVGEVLRAA